MQKKYFVLGVSDPEMKTIETVLRTQGQSFVYATVSGKRVHPGNAYAADPVDIARDDTAVWVECRAREAEDGITIDHHRPGDPGFGRSAAEYWEASSLGQLYTLLELGAPEHYDRALAAMDHCFPAAVRGECPGVTPEEVLNVKYHEIAEGTGSAPEAVQADVTHYRNLIMRAPVVIINTQIIKDMRSEYAGEGYSRKLLTLQVAATIAGQGILLRHRDYAGGPEKWSLSGHILPETVTTFLESWAPEHGLTKTYGVPDRGYAGGYLVG